MDSSNRSLIALSREQILCLSQNEKLDYFRQLVVRHPNMEERLEDIMTLSEPNTGTDIILMIGPTGVGKSASIETVQRKYIQKYKSELQSDTSFIPIASIEAPASGEGRFAWRILYRRLGEALNEPLLERKVLSVAQRQAFKMPGLGNTVAALRVSMETALKYRRTRLLVIDEAAHILTGGESKLVDHMNALKSLANVSGVTLMLVGSYDLYRLPILSGQLARRMAVVHLGRYVDGDKRDADCFRRTLLALQKALPLDAVPDLEQHSTNLQRACAGCVGILKDTLMRALAMSLQKGKWKDDFLRRALLPDAQLAAILKETLDGERLLRESTFPRPRADWLESA